MINTFKYFHTYMFRPSNKKIITIDGSVNIVVGEHNLKFTLNIVLENMLRVP